MKKGISFRFEEDVIDTITLGSEISGTTKTTFVAEAILLLTDLLEQERFRGMSIDEIRSHVLSTTQPVTSKKVSRKGKNRPPGFISDIILDHLKKNKGVLMSTTQIAEELSIPKSTTRAYVRKLLSEHDGELEMREGRPNQVRYIGK